MEITLVNAGAQHGIQHGMTAVSVAANGRTFLLSGVNLLRPLGVPLGNLPVGVNVQDMGGIDMGMIAAFDGNMVAPGQAVTPIVTITPPADFIFGNDFVRLGLAGGALSIEQGDPGAVQHVPMNTNEAVIVQDWTLSDGNNLMSTLPAFEQALPLGLNHVNEGALAHFTDQAGVDAVGLVVDVNPTPGGGATVRAVMLSQVINLPGVQALLR